MFAFDEVTQGRPRGGIAIEDLGEGFGNDSLKAILGERLRGVLAGGAAAEVDACHEDGGVLKSFVVERVISLLAGDGIEADVVESVFSESVEGDALHEASRDDTIGIDVGAGNRDRWSGKVSDGCNGHGIGFENDYLKAGVMV